MRTYAAAAVGLVAGFFAGLMLDVVIGVGGLMTGGEPAGIRFLPIGTAVLGALVAVVVYRRVHRDSR